MFTCRSHAPAPYAVLFDPRNPRAPRDRMPDSATPPREPYGPGTGHVREFLRRLAQQPPMVWMAAARAYEAGAATNARLRADRALGHAIEENGRQAARDAVIGPVVQLANHVATSLGGDAATVDRLAEPALAAVLALIAEDLLADADVSALLEPFAGAIPRAALQRGG